MIRRPTKPIKKPENVTPAWVSRVSSVMHDNAMMRQAKAATLKG